MKRFFLIILASFILLGCAVKQGAIILGDEKAHVFHWNGSEILLPPPEWAASSQYIDPRLKKYINTMTPPGGAQCVYWGQDPAHVEKGPDGSYSFRLAIGLCLPAPEGSARKVFSQIQTQYRNEWDEYLKKHPDVFKEIEKDVSEALRKYILTSIELETGKPAMLGMIIDQPNAVSNLMKMPINLSIQGRNHPVDCLLSTTSILVNENILTVYVQSTSNEKISDAEWVIAKTREWVDQILKANGEKGLEPQENC
ncbi:hypothetical protein SAMN02745216_02352 [Desulfatibacillum alkenivorans DSM 16219]|jgi:hypothetical protein|uniref:Lipoprotein n=1 Tax=Desulfatibacillum alkenivorans DSM 16219 TaxID=1121393 RepID=A0A1M6MG88_9BACT|nr:hypothetical protein [Desulfatibacillum alkenivorans]SHJ82458.1 hypothetical protein SAMN02745216_02352 [Desulfatibacillum alkenivorans DSM 16219]